MIECGYVGRNSDEGIFHASAIKYWLTHSGLDIPSPTRLPNDLNEFLCSFYLVEDEAFPLTPYLIRPYSKRIHDNTKNNFQLSLKSWSKTIECAFGMMCEKLQVLNSPIRCRDVEKINCILKSVCVFHNFVRKREGIQYRTSQHEECVAVLPLQNDNMPNIEINIRSSANDIRNYLAAYFITPPSSISSLAVEILYLILYT
ncbi:Harbinger transposase-derived nuclease domain [Cinara cedri]|uniref:Harbinger transposase-derived nuclease domain n=1 Tax=Cinara cedri TaxID=506608 RepID=A0A5E4MH13_9HEMI|nr:Harbinger transposase-derived nuclease domain [Cinara cedri]